MVEPPEEPTKSSHTTRLQPFPRRGESFVQPLSAPDATATPKQSIFNDSRRPLSLGINLSLAILLFPILWFGFFILWSLGGERGTDKQQLDNDRAIILMAAATCALAIVGVAVHWIHGRHRVAPEKRTPLRSTEGLVSAVVVLALSGCMAALAIKLWNTVI